LPGVFTKDLRRVSALIEIMHDIAGTARIKAEYLTSYAFHGV
jgi:hypothetical protein